jgi:hypothetical protein
MLQVRRAKVPSKEHQQHLIQHTTLLFSLLRHLSMDLRRRLPDPLCRVKCIVVLEDGVIVASIDDDFVPVGDHGVESSGVGQYFFKGVVVEIMDVDLGKGMNKLSSGLAYISFTLPPKT